MIMLLVFMLIVVFDIIDTTCATFDSVPKTIVLIVILSGVNTCVYVE